MMIDDYTNITPKLYVYCKGLIYLFLEIKNHLI